VAAAAEALGRPHRVEGVIVRGDQRGRQLGFPTANFLLGTYTAVPADGVYAGWVIRGDERLPAAASVGTNPTFSGEDRRVEAHILDFDGDLYGERLGLELVANLRGQVKYDGIEPLIAQIKEDVAQTRTLLSK
jgi:riboflavin kinase/FMN adenylyltransferase